MTKEQPKQEAQYNSGAKGCFQLILVIVATIAITAVIGFAGYLLGL
jgi:cytochrome b subunit of formate dehydrogenase